MREMKDETRKAENKTRIRDCLKKRAFWKGSYTVEAALVFPIILFVLAALLITLRKMSGKRQQIRYGIRRGRNGSWGAEAVRGMWRLEVQRSMCNIRQSVRFREW